MLTHSAVTFTQAGGHSVNFPLQELKLVYREDFLGNKELLVGEGANSIVFTDAYSRATIEKIAADFAVLSRAAQTPEAAQPAPSVAALVVAAPAASGPASGGYASKRLAVKVEQKCENNPSAASFLLDEDEDDCSADVLDSIRKKISAVFASKGFLANVGDNNADLVLTVTMTKRRLDTGAGGFLGDFAATAITAANYALANSADNPLISGTVSDEDGNDDDEDALELKFANKLAAEVVAKLPAERAARLLRLHALAWKWPIWRRLSLKAWDAPG